MEGGGAAEHSMQQQRSDSVQVLCMSWSSLQGYGAMLER